LLSLGLACAGLAENKGVTDNEIIMGTCNALSGPSQFGGKETTIGINTYMNELNEAGGINGRKVKVISEDDKYEPETAIVCFQKMMVNNAFGISGAYGSTCLAKYIPLCVNNKIPCVGHYAGTHFVGDPVKRYVFNARAAYKDEQHALVDKLWDVGIRKIAVIYQKDPYGVDQLDGIKEGLAKHGAQIIASGEYVRNSNNIADAFNAVKVANPEVVVLGAVYTPCAKVAALAREANWNPIFVINSGSSEEAFIKEAGKDAEGKLVTEVAPAVSETGLPLVAKYIKALKKYYPNEKPGSVSLRGYIDAMVWAEGLKRAGKNVDREKFVDGLESIHNLDVGLGKGMALSYSPSDHLGFHKVFFGVVKNGEVVSFTDWKKLKTKSASKAETK
jgi:branched-chain amino acid transport system substrate-binding protein